MTGIIELRALLERYAVEATHAEEPAEHAAVGVDRIAGFANEASTPAGHIILLDEPASIGGGGAAPDPAEYLLAAVGASLSVTLTAHAAMRGLVLDHVRVDLTAVMDGRAFFRPGHGTTGLVDCTLVLTVKSTAPAALLRMLVDDAVSVAPVLCALKIAPRIETRIVGAS